MEIRDFSPEVFRQAREFFAAHPVFEMVQLREIAVEGPGGELVQVLKGTCTKCGFELAPADNPMLEGQGAMWPADTLKATRLTHAWDQATRSTYCGGRVVFTTAPMPLLVGP